MLKNGVVQLRAELVAILKELQSIMDTKLGLELEIATYRKLLGSEKNRSEERSRRKDRVVSVYMIQKEQGI